MSIFQHVGGFQVSARGVTLLVPDTPSFDEPATTGGRTFRVEIFQEPASNLWQRLPIDDAFAAGQIARAKKWEGPSYSATVLFVALPATGRRGAIVREWMLSALSLFLPVAIRPGPLVLVGRVARLIDSEDVTAGQFDCRSLTSEEVWCLSSDDGVRFSAFVSELSKLCSTFLRSTRLKIARRYFEKSSLAEAPEDRVLLLTVALEALLSPSGNDELKFRIASRASLLLGGSHHDVEHTFELVRSAYDIRSAVAHGAFDSFATKPCKAPVGRYLRALGLPESAGVDPLLSALHHLVRYLIVYVAWLDHTGFGEDAIGRTTDHPRFVDRNGRSLPALPVPLTPVRRGVEALG